MKPSRPSTRQAKRLVRLARSGDPARKKKVVDAISSGRIDASLVGEWLAAAEHGDLATLKRLLRAEPRLVDELGQGPYWEGNFRALHYAAHRNHRNVVRWLLAHRASAAPVVGDGDWAPLHFAAFGGHKDSVRLLIQHGAQMDIFRSEDTRLNSSH